MKSYIACIVCTSLISASELSFFDLPRKVWLRFFLEFRHKVESNDLEAVRRELHYAPGYLTATDANDRNVLFFAPSVDMVELLIMQGINLDALDVRGKTALDHFSGLPDDEKNRAIIRLLMQHKAPSGAEEKKE